MSSERSYILGTHDEELTRLGLQHRVWRSAMLRAWASAGLTEGMRVMDLGCGPGFASIDLAETVGSGGEVLGIEQSARFIAHARGTARQRGLSQVRFIETDLMHAQIPAEAFHMVWCRWVASFVADPLVLPRIAYDALLPGGAAVFHEYVNYGAWRTIPDSPVIGEFVSEVMRSWVDAGGCPDIAIRLLPGLLENGLALVSAEPLQFAVRPHEFAWRWPAAFIRSNAKQLVEAGRQSSRWAERVWRELESLEQNANAVMMTPSVLQIIVRKRA